MFSPEQPGRSVVASRGAFEDIVEAVERTKGDSGRPRLILLALVTNAGSPKRRSLSYTSGCRTRFCYTSGCRTRFSVFGERVGCLFGYEESTKESVLPVGALYGGSISGPSGIRGVSSSACSPRPPPACPDPIHNADRSPPPACPALYTQCGPQTPTSLLVGGNSLCANASLKTKGLLKE